MNFPYILITAITFVVILVVLVLVHELGHFLTARLFGVRVEEFGIGFPPRVYPSPAVVARRRAARKTVYSLNALPLGGFVRLAGENGVTAPVQGGESGRDFGAAALGGTAAAADDPGAFANKPGWQRAIILVAGAFNNMVLAMVLLFAGLTLIGTPHTSVAVIGIAQGSPAERAQVRAGDIVARVDGVVPQSTVDVRDIVAAHPGQPITLELQNGKTIRTVSLTPRAAAGLPCDEGPIGIMTNPVNERYEPLSPGRAAPIALNVPGTVVQGIAGLFGGLQSVPSSTPTVGQCLARSAYITFGGHIATADQLQNATPVRGAVADDPCLLASANDSGISGPIGILKQVGCEANAVPSQGVMPLLLLIVELSATLAVVNLLPVPALDGGRLLFVLISIVARRRVRPEIEGLAHAMGMIALLTLMLVVSFHDITGHWL